MRMMYHIIKDHREIPYNLNKNKYAIVHGGYEYRLQDRRCPPHVRNTTPISCEPQVDVVVAYASLC